MFEMTLLTARQRPIEPPKGQKFFTSVIYNGSFVVPNLVTSLSIVVIGGGGGYQGWNGADGKTAYIIDTPVTPGEILKVTVGAGGAKWSDSGNGEASYVQRGSKLLAYGDGGMRGWNGSVTGGTARALVPGGRVYGGGGGSPSAAGSLTGIQGAVRIIWGPGRPTPPYNAPDV